MLNNDAMAQLQGLKNQIEAEKEHAEATVKGTQNRYGFAVVDDGREVFLPPDEMLKVLPGDRINICIRPAAPAKGKKAKGDRTIAEVESLIECTLGRFVGRIVAKGKAIFVAPDLPQLHRWLFIPPHARNGARPGDYVECALLRHPIRDGKPSAKVLTRLGDEHTPGIENRYCATRAGITWEWPEKTANQIISHARTKSPTSEAERADLTHLDFVSIDAARTQDIDDALYAEVTNEGWSLYVAVADPTAYLADAPGILEEITERGTSVYFHGDMVPMLPEAISREFCALVEDETRPALVCKLSVSDDGKVSDYEFMQAQVRSRAKLSYAAVDRYVTGHNDELIAHSSPLEALVQAYRALRSRREREELVMEERREYRWHLNEQRQIDHIDSAEKLASQRLVEECMIAANRCAAHFLAMADSEGPYVIHPGFRKDRLGEAKEFLTRHRPALADVPLETLDGYRQVLSTLAQPDNELPLHSMVNRLLTRAELSRVPSEHMGMALQAYTNFTSPLRKAVDFLVHLQVKAVLSGQGNMTVDTQWLSTISKSLGRCREATLSAERWLGANYLQQLAAGDTRRFTGQVSHITSSGFTVKLDDNGLEGLVDLRKDAEKFSFDKWTASLTSTTRRFQLGQAVEVEFKGAGPEDGFIAHFEPVEGCGLKAQKPAQDDDAASE
jgi:VacB/RNase II family 3'-5' exoribonuclease